MFISKGSVILLNWWWAFNISKKVVRGCAVEPNAAMVSEWVTIPLPFHCDIRVRSEQKAALLADPGYAIRASQTDHLKGR